MVRGSGSCTSGRSQEASAHRACSPRASTNAVPRVATAWAANICQSLPAAWAGHDGTERFRGRSHGCVPGMAGDQRRRRRSTSSQGAEGPVKPGLPGTQHTREDRQRKTEMRENSDRENRQGTQRRKDCRFGKAPAAGQVSAGSQTQND